MCYTFEYLKLAVNHRFPLPFPPKDGDRFIPPTDRDSINCDPHEGITSRCRKYRLIGEKGQTHSGTSFDAQLLNCA